MELTNQEIEDIVQRDLAKKIRLEREFKPKVRKLFKKILKYFRSHVSLTGVPPSSSMYQDEWEALLLEHYEDVQKAFLGSVRSTMKGFAFKQEDDQEDSALEELLFLAFAAWRNQGAPKAALSITETTDQNFLEAIAKGTESLREQGKDVTPRGLANESSVFLARRFSGREKTISIVETQGAAESTKLAEAEVSAGGTPYILTGVSDPDLEMSKTWKDSDDSLVRAPHKKADGQTVSVDKPFSVGGEEFMFPGDKSLGASIWNWINCRCAAIYQALIR